VLLFDKYLVLLRYIFNSLLLWKYFISYFQMNI